jgi:hypothetical protein
MTTTDLDALRACQWTRQPQAAQLVAALTEELLAHCPPAATLAQRMLDHTGTRFADWIDFIALPPARDLAAQAHDAGFIATALSAPGDAVIFAHPEGIFPRLVFRGGKKLTLALKVDSVSDFLAAQQISAPIDGEPLSPLRQALAAQTDTAALLITERHGWPHLVMPAPDPSRGIEAAHHLEVFRTRPRDFPDDAAGFAHAAQLIDTAIADLGPTADQTCDLFFTAEREFWQRRNRAAQVQKARQDRLGLGWANHDHHTYRSSRRHFATLIALLEKLGFICRERFYAGREAGWGAQVLEQPADGLVVFADVDLGPEEILLDFAHQPLPQRNSLGTVGLWCALHGEAFLQAGLHHLECQFDFEALKRQLECEHHIPIMKPFTDLPYLRQAFTEGETWPVQPARLDRLLADRLITPEQAVRFAAHGALGSHLENLQRNDGYKGFNQKGVSDIITATDPRQCLAGA